LRVEGSGCRVQGSGFRVQGSGFRVQGPGNLPARAACSDVIVCASDAASPECVRESESERVKECESERVSDCECERVRECVPGTLPRLCFRVEGLKGYLAYKKQPCPLGPP